MIRRLWREHKERKAWPYSDVRTIGVWHELSRAAFDESDAGDHAAEALKLHLYARVKHMQKVHRCEFEPAGPIEIKIGDSFDSFTRNKVVIVCGQRFAKMRRGASKI